MLLRHATLCVALTILCLGNTQAQQRKSESPPSATPIQAETMTPGRATTESKANATAPLTIEQIRANLPATAADKFEFLRNQRKTTLDAISNVSSQLLTVDSKISSLQVSERTEQNDKFAMTPEKVRDDLTRAKEQQAEAQKRLDAVRASKQSTPDQIGRAEAELESKKGFASTVQSVLTDTEAREKTRAERNKDLERLRTEREDQSARLLSYQRLLGSIDDMVNQLFIASDATNSFKLKMSIAFSVLVGVVIVGFFGIAWSNDEIKKTIFANEAGIQFITVFSIVIAVILFGIIGVLESKELSALLGGLSGYILGRSRPQTVST